MCKFWLRSSSLIIVTLFISGGFLFAQVSKDTKAQEIITNARSAISKGRDVQNIRGFACRLEETSTSTSKQEKGASGRTEITSTTEISVEILKPKINYLWNADIRTGDANNGQQFEFKLDGKSFSFADNVMFEGKVIASNLSVRTREVAIKKLNQSLFRDTFHFSFDSSWYAPLQFSYKGIAESKNQKANIIETTLDDTTYRLFFDSETNLLLLMTRTLKDASEKTIEFKHYYSDYKEFDGILLPTKIKTERDNAYFAEQVLKSVKFDFKP